MGPYDRHTFREVLRVVLPKAVYLKYLRPEGKFFVPIALKHEAKPPFVSSWAATKAKATVTDLLDD